MTMNHSLRSDRRCWPWQYSRQAGSTLIEAVLGVAIVLSVFYALTNLGTIAIRSSQLASDQVTASHLAQEVLEILRARRADLGWSAIENLGLGTLLCIDHNGVITSQNCYAGNNFAYPVNSKFERTILVERVRRATASNGTNCPAGCSACGTIGSSGTDDNCTRKITIQVAWPSTADNCQGPSVLEPRRTRYCAVTVSYLTNW